MGTASCKSCQVQIVFGWNLDTERWVPLDPMSLSEDGHEEVFRGGVILESFHRRHRCDIRSRFKQKAPPRSPPIPRRSPDPSPPREPQENAKAKWERMFGKPFDPPPWSPHATLFLLPGAPLELIRAAHRVLALIHHPDRGGSTERMVEINLAYEVLIGGKQ